MALLITATTCHMRMHFSRAVEPPNRYSGGGRLGRRLVLVHRGHKGGDELRLLLATQPLRSLRGEG